MRLRSCVTSHFISSLEDGMVKKVHNTNSNGRPFLKLKKLKDIHQAADAMLQNGCDDTNALIEPTHLPLADRKTKALNGYALEEKDQTESSSDEDISDDLKLSQLKNRRKKKRKASESVLTPKTDFDDSDLNEPLFKFKVKARKTSTNKIPSNESFLETAIVKVEALEVDYFEYREKIDTVDVPLVSNESATFIASESGVIMINHEIKSENSESFTNVGEVCGFNFDNLDDTKNMVLDNEENMLNVNQSPSDVNSVEDDSTVEDMTTSTSDSSESQLTPEQVNHFSDVQDSVNADVDLDSLNSDTVPVVLGDTPIIQEQPSEVNFSIDNYETDMKNEASDCVETQHMERIPSTRKAISPTSQEKLCLAMTSEELLDDMDRYKCKEKLSFEEQPDNKFSSTASEIVYNDTKADITPKPVKKPKSYKKLSPPKKSLSSKSCLDGPRLCRSLPRLSTGSTTVEGCSESAIAFSQRQMHDIESLASKLMSELNSMKVIVEEKLLFEAYRSTSLKNETDEVKSAIKSATKTEETAKKWLSMMARDCNRFCKIMKLTEDPELVEEKAPVEREKKKISFADEVGGRLCDIKVYEIDQTSLESKQYPES